MLQGKVSIDEIFMKDRYFIVPNYQRSYAWGKKQQRDFFDDFKNNYSNTNYYYGTLLLQEVEKKENLFEIVDGQQRITTLIIFMYCLINKLKKIDIKKYNIEEDEINDLEGCFIKYKGNYKLTLQEQDTGFFYSCILGEDANFTIMTPAQEKLMNAKKNFINWLNELSNNEIELVNLISKIKKANVLVYVIKNRKEASMIFETTNDRGKLLTNLEKQKSYLMYKVSATLKEPDQLLLIIQKAFTKIYTDFEKVGNIFDENSILQYNFIANEPWKNENGKKEYQAYMDVLKNKIESLIKEGKKEIEKNNENNKETEEEYKLLKEYINKYMIDLQNTYDHISQFMKDREFLEVNDMRSIGRMANFYPLLIKCYKYDKSEEKEKFKNVCRMCEIFSFRVYVIGKYASNKYQTKWYDLARDFNGDFERLYIAIASLTRNLSSDEDFIKKLCDNNFYGNYKTPERNYLFWKYENYLRTKQPVATLMTHKDLWEKENKKLKLSIEHIVAQANSEEQQKIIIDSDIIDIGNEDTFNKEFLNSIGNLTIDPQSANSSKGNKNVEAKISKYFEKAPYKSQNELEDFLEIVKKNRKKMEKWTIKSITNRRNKILEFAKETWCRPLDKYEQINEEIEEFDDIEE